MLFDRMTDGATEPLKLAVVAVCVEFDKLTPASLSTLLYATEAIGLALETDAVRSMRPREDILMALLDPYDELLP